MSLKETLRFGIQALGGVPVLSLMLYHPSVRELLSRVKGAHVLYPDGWNRVHPFDREHDTDTSGTVSAEEMRKRSNHPAFQHMTVYGGSQPSLVRTALSKLPHLDRCTFVDLGCGKGRPLLVASEFPFRDIVGVELSADLARTARRNAEIVAERYPERSRVRVEEGDATEFRLPDGDLVVFLYNPFGAPLVAKVVQRVEEALIRDPHRRLFVVLYNPVNGALFDASTGLTRRFAAMLDYAPEELGYGPDLCDALLIWQGGSAPPVSAPPRARIVIRNAGSRAELAP